LTDRRVAAVPIREGGEALVDVAAVASLRTDPLLARTSHGTGAAVDVTLCTEAGGQPPMGCEVYAGPLVSAGRCHTDSPDLPEAARTHRETLRRAMTGAGLVNLPAAWWHWSYGDRYWCSVTGAAAAPYGPVSAETGQPVDAQR
jgi:D-alanyl-D-alanine dipeptidase